MIVFMVIAIIVTLLGFAVAIFDKDIKLGIALCGIALIVIGGGALVTKYNEKAEQSISPNVVTFVTDIDMNSNKSENKTLSSSDIQNYDEIIKLIESKSSRDAFTRDLSHTGIIFAGDSRFNGMNISCHIDDNEHQFVVAKDGAGYGWFSTDGLAKINKIIADNPDITDWILVSGFGVNDLGNSSNYLSLYDELDEAFDIVLVSINPVDGNTNVTNSDIESFNTILRGTNYKYINTYDTLLRDGYKTTDGLHYDNDTYSNIYEHICKLLSI